MNTTNSCPKLEQLYPFINWQLLNNSSSVGQVTIVGITHHPYLISNIEQPTRLSFFQDDRYYSCHLSQGIKIVSSQHGDRLYVFSFSLDKEYFSQQYICPFRSRSDRSLCQLRRSAEGCRFTICEAGALRSRLLMV